MNLLLRWLISAGSILLVAWLLEGIDVTGPGAALVAALVLGLVNAVIRPVVLFLTMPIGCVTLGLFTFVVNALMFWLVGAVVDGFEVRGFVPALIGSLLVSVISTVASRLWADRGER
ncbi:phage holin family protein [Thermaerobacter sp. PB12/4term]|uniref:phage holin family protein n=1 Tax=Thermaerobacter sp. PB12/4term TaxID=2293838 RepID=UPI000E327571|nr:phage holin family protein [Thermaerobacter sp. PB12/4term]QIA26275.1 phage holin family protein [Thermaerobacter sp. PB12/4term]